MKSKVKLYDIVVIITLLLALAGVIPKIYIVYVLVPALLYGIFYFLKLIMGGNKS